ncbi:hypothetical protein Tco_0791652 [Tanacetum coccineum]
MTIVAGDQHMLRRLTYAHSPDDVSGNEEDEDDEWMTGGGGGALTPAYPVVCALPANCPVARRLSHLKNR